MDYRNACIISDIDRTILPDGLLEIPKANIDSARKFMDGGGIFVLCSGRTRSSLWRYQQQINPTYSAYANGAAMSETKSGDFVYSLLLSEKEYLQSGEFAKKHPEIAVTCNSDDNIYITHPTQYMTDYYGKAKIPFEVRDFLPERLLKINFSGLRQDIIRPLVEELYGDSAKIIPVGDENIDVINKNASKGSAVKYFQNTFCDRKVFAIGDFFNDVEMLEVADYPVCPQNAHDEIKKMCHVLNNTCEDSISELLEYIKSI